MPMLNTTFAGTTPNNYSGGWLPSASMGAVAPTLTQEQMDGLSMQIYNQTRGTDIGVSPWEHIARFSTGTALDIVDTVWSSPLNPMGGDRGDVISMASPEMQEYYQRHKGAIESTSAIIGGLGTAIALEAMVIPKMAQALSSSAAITGTAPWRIAESWNVSSRANMLAAQKLAAEAGESFSLFGSQAGRQFLYNRAAAGVAMTTRTMPVEYAVMWNNEVFNTGDWSTEGFWIGAGAALGGVLGTIGARATARQIANSAEIRNLYAEPLSMAGTSNDLLSANPLDWVSRVNKNQVELKESAFTTEWFIRARAASTRGYDEAAANETKLSSLRGSAFSQAVDSTQKLISAGINGIDTIKAPVKGLPEALHIVNNVAKTDVAIFHGLSEIGLPKTTLSEAKEARKVYIESLQKAVDKANKLGNIKEAQQIAAKARIMKNQEDFALVDGAWHDTDSELVKAVVDFKPEKIDIQAIKGTEGVKLKLPISGKMILDASLTPRDIHGATIEVGKLPMKDRLHLIQAANDLVRKLSRKDAKIHFKLDQEGAKSWFTLDTAAEIMDRGGKIEFDPKLANMQTIEDMRRESLRLKANAALREIGATGQITPEVRFKYNLPKATAMERIEDPAGDLFRAWLVEAAGAKHSANELAMALDDMRTIQGLDLRKPEGARTSRVDGDMFNFNRDKNGTWLRPMLGYFDKRNPIEKLSQQGHSNAVTLARAERTYLLINNNTHVGALSKSLVEMPETRTAMNIEGMDRAQVTGTGGGLGQAVSEVLPERFRARDNATILAASKLQEHTERHGRAVFAELMQKVGMQDIVTRITSAGHAAQRAMLDQYFSLRPGWDIEKATDLGGGKFGFLLKDTATNRARLGLKEGEKWTPQLLQNERLGKPIVVDDVALSAIDSFNKLTDELFKADNAIRKATKLLPIKYKPFFTPVPNTKGAIVGFVFDQNDKLVPGWTIVARSQQEYEQATKRTLAEFGDGSGYTVKTREQVEQAATDYDMAQMDWIDPGVSAAHGRMGAQAGGLTGAFVKQGAFTEALEWVQRKTAAQSQDALRQLMREQIQISRAMATADRALRPETRGIYDLYEQALTGRSRGYADTAILDKGLRRAEEIVDKVLANSALSLRGRQVLDVANRIGMNPADFYGKRTYKEIVAAMGPHTPFANVTEYLESRGVKRPPTVKGIASKLNFIAASVMLRWLELPHALLNGLGLIATIPSTVLGGRAPISTFVNVGGKNIGVVDGTKIVANGMKRMFARGANADWQHMVKNGDTTQSVLEYHQQLGTIQSQAGFMKWAKNVDKWASIASEKSEAWSRQVAHFIGLELADYHGIKGMEARHNFAREIANSMIADYAPVNRPELFRSGFGSLLGLFQSYALNHYSKMFRWMETGDYAKAGLQAAVQASMFGVPGTYGIGALMDLRDSSVSSGSEPTALDLIYQRFGPVLGGAIAHGGISELTQLALWTRGDMTPRIPGAAGLPPALDVGMKVANGFMDGVNAFMSAMPGEGANAVLEVVQREMPNRVLRSWLTLANGGNEIDAYGRVMTDTQGWLSDVVARVIGVRSRRQQAELEAFYASKSAMDRDAVRMERLRKSFRSAVRNANGDVSQVSPIQYFNDYVEAGGNPRAFKTWVRNLMRDSNNPRSMDALRSSLSTPRSALELWRYGAYGGWAVQ